MIYSVLSTLVKRRIAEREGTEGRREVVVSELTPLSAAKTEIPFNIVSVQDCVNCQRFYS